MRSSSIVRAGLKTKKKKTKKKKKKKKKEEKKNKRSEEREMESARRIELEFRGTCLI